MSCLIFEGIGRIAMMAREEQDKQLYNSIAAKYSSKDVVLSSSLARRYKLFFSLAQVLGQAENIGTLVEVGCGIGATAAYLRGRYAHYVGIDYSEELIKRARELHRDNHQAEFIADNIKSENLPVRCADVLYASGVLHHVTELDDAMECLARLAKPGAWLIACEPQNSNPLISALRNIRGVVDAAYSKDQVFFHPAFLEDLFFRHGLIDLSIRFHGYVSTPFAEVVFQPQIFFAPLAKMAVGLDRLFERVLPAPLRKMSFNVVVSGRFAWNRPA